MERLKIATMAAALLALATAPTLGAQEVLAGGLVSPFKAATTPGGNVLVTETGTGAHDGALTMITSFGARFGLIDGLPSGVGPEAPTGPTAVVDRHRTVYVLIGEGDVLGASPPPLMVPNPDGLTSPIYSSVLRAVFDPVPDGIREGFTLTTEHRQALADGRTVELVNSAGESLELDVLADLRDLSPDPVTGVRASNPFGLGVWGRIGAEDLAALGLESLGLDAANFLAKLLPDSALGRRLAENTTLYVADAGMNSLVEIDAVSGRASLLARFEPSPNPAFPALGGPVVEAVPSGIHVTDETVYVALLRGFPFAQGTGAVLAVDRRSGEVMPFLEGLTTATDVVIHEGASYVLELSGDLLSGAPGRVLRFASPTAAPGTETPEVLAPVVIGGTGLAMGADGRLLVVESFTGRLLRLSTP